MSFRRYFLLLAMVAAGPGRLPAKEAAIAASATAVSDYVRPTDAKGAPQPESYVFAEGKFFRGNTQDGSLEKMTFPTVTKMLATNLAKQNYFPAADLNSAQLLIVVHRGTTDIFEDPQRDINIQALNDAMTTYNDTIAESGRADPSELNMAVMDREGAQASTTASINRNAVLLGYARNLQKERRELLPTAAEITMSQELNEERYFVILVAFDYQELKKNRRPKVRWITRLSVRSVGTNFTEALPALAKVGAEVFGQQRDDLVRVKAQMQRGTVKLGELEILGTVPNPTPDKPAGPEKKDK